MAYVIRKKLRIFLDCPWWGRPYNRASLEFNEIFGYWSQEDEDKDTLAFNRTGYSLYKVIEFKISKQAEAICARMDRFYAVIGNKNMGIT